jgi:hypothetical protein
MLEPMLLWVGKMAAASGWRQAEAWLSRVGGQKIEIETPRPDEALRDKQPLGEIFSYSVEGKLKHLPRGHKVWLLVEHELSKEIWPQGFYTVIHNEESKKWAGRVATHKGATRIKIIATVAPPTSDQFFRYFQTTGNTNQNKFVPLSQIPVECKNIDEVQARIL